MIQHHPEFRVRFAADDGDVQAAQRLRYDVFVAELGGSGAKVDHERGLEVDRFDPFAKHLLLEDLAPEAPSRLVGVYRLMTAEDAAAAGAYYTEAEFDISRLKQSGRRLLELGRSCLHADYRGGAAMLHLWSGLAAFVEENGIEVMFGTASFHGTDVGALAHPLSHLHFTHAAPANMMAVARDTGAVKMDVLTEDKVDRKAAILAIPPLIKAYLRLGGVVGQSAFVDHTFNTTDVCLILDTATMNSRARAQMTQGAVM